MKKRILPYTFFIALLTCTVACSSDDNNLTNVTTDGFKEIVPSVASPLIQPTGFYIANEDWFGHDNGSINFLDYQYNPTYRIYTEANGNKTLGVTTTYAVAFGENYYIVSKQGNRLVVTDKNFKEVKSFTDTLGDGRAFVGISDTKGYISTIAGITIYNISTKTIERKIDGITKQTGNMVYVDGKVYAVVQGEGLVIIDTHTDRIIDKMNGGYTQVTLDKHGIVWAGKGNELVRINPMDTKDTKTYAIANAPINGTWGAWNPGSLTSSMQEDALYWTTANKVVKFNTTSEELNTDFHTLGEDETKIKLAFYGGGLRVDPVKGDLVLLIKRNGWGDSGSYNWTRIISKDGALKKEIFMQGGTNNDKNGYYWFPSIPFFQDNNSPEILANQFVLKPQTTLRVPLKDLVVDQDNSNLLIEKQVEEIDKEFGTVVLEGNELILKAKSKLGKTTLTMKAISNGKSVTKVIDIWIRN